MPIITLALLHVGSGGGDDRQRGTKMDDEIFTEYEREVQKARQEANKLAREANENLQYFTERGVQKPELVTMYIGTYAGKDMSKIKFDETIGKFVPLTHDAVLWLGGKELVKWTMRNTN